MLARLRKKRINLPFGKHDIINNEFKIHLEIFFDKLIAESTFSMVSNTSAVAGAVVFHSHSEALHPRQHLSPCQLALFELLMKREDNNRITLNAKI